MCDCYYHRCNHGDCTQTIYIHLGDFETERDEIEVFCATHLPKDRSNGRLFKLRRGKSSTRVFIRYLTDNARDLADYNHPNERPYEILEDHVT